MEFDASALGAVIGTIKKVDPSALRLTIAIKNKDKKPPADREFAVGPATKFIFYPGAEKKEVTGKDVFKVEQLKEGAAVMVFSDGKGNATEVRVGMPPKSEKP